MYKRQAQTQEAKGDTSKSQAQGGENAAQTKKEQRRNTWTNEDGSIRPVSYTHLDVYKRQLLKYRTVYKHMQEFLDIRYHVKDIALKELTPAH